MTWSLLGQIHPPAVELLPTWLNPVATAVDGVDASRITTFLPTAGQGRHSAVLILFGPDRDLLLIERAHDASMHSGQPAFPGGVVEATDAGVTQAAIREAQEETGLDPRGVIPFGQLPDLWIPVSNFVVTPILGYWDKPSPVAPGDPREVASVHRIKIDDFVNPANRVRIGHPSGYIGDGFTVSDLVVWGFTAGLISTMLDLAGWQEPWDQRRIIPLEEFPSRAAK